MFAIAQIIRMLEEGGTIVQEAMPSLRIRDALKGFRDVLRYPLSVIRSIGLGIYIGILPALGVTTATITAYLTEKKYSREREQFGQGAPSGLVAAEVSKGCCVVGDMIPTFMLGIPGSVTGAIIMAAFIMHGIQPGPQFLLSGAAPYVVFAGIILAQVLIVIAGLPLIKSIGHIVKIPNTLIAPILTVLCFIGAFAERNITFDIFFMIIFGVLGYALDRLRYSLISLIIGLILGPLIESNFHRTLAMGYGSLHLLWTRPITVIFFVITFLFLAWPYIKDLYLALRGRPYKGLNNYEVSSDLTKVTGGEIILLVVLITFSVVMLVDARAFPGKVGLFPRIICYAMLTLIVCRLAPLLFRRIKVSQVRWRKPWLSLSAMSWEWSIGTLALYYLLIYAVGFMAATAVYLLAIPLLLRHRNKFIILALFVPPQSLGSV